MSAHPVIPKVWAGFAATVMALGLGVSAMAQIPGAGLDAYQAPPDAHWTSIAVEDVEGAYRLLHDNHPGAAPELHDLAFQARLTTAHALALSRARTVTAYQGYIATLAGFATDMDDKHIWSRPSFVVNLPLWTGVIVSKQGDAWVVTDTDPQHAALMSATLNGCDGVDVQTLARKNLGGFHADWSVGAQQFQSAPWLLVDEANPFITRPTTCTFEQKGARQEVKLDWTRIKREALLPRLKKAGGAGAAGFGVRQVGGGYWIALQDLDSDQAGAVVKEVEAQKDAMRAAPFVVFDLRGNGGGSSEVGRQVANALMGQAAVDGRLGPVSGSSCGDDGAWRASDGNIKNLEFLLQYVRLQGGAEAEKILGETLAQAKAARAAGRAFSSSIACLRSEAQPLLRTQPASLMKGRLILLTDNLCFSSCLVVTDDFRHLGAFHVGQTTDAATHFTEVREEYLPSGESMFSTLQSVNPNGPPQEGPYAPSLTYNGDIAATPAVQAWVTGTAVPAAMR